MRRPIPGRLKGSNFSVVLLDQILAQDAAGKPVDAVRGAALVIPAKKQGMEKAVAVSIGGLFSPASYAPGPYSTYVYAKADLDRKAHSDPTGMTSVEETWSFTAESGDSVQVQVQYIRGVPVRANAEALVYSAAKPDFYRIYRFEQATDVVRSAVTGIDRAQKVSFKASGRQLTPLFDGSEQLISVTVNPWYSRQISFRDRKQASRKKATCKPWGFFIRRCGAAVDGRLSLLSGRRRAPTTR